MTEEKPAELEEQLALLEEMQKPSYFYTTDTPHEWSSGPSVWTRTPKGELIESLEHARQLALDARKGRSGYSGHVVTTYGVSYRTGDRD